ncbi:hypothetical protein ASZ90_016657 [hydrocarbon metagenome]|uniref:Uncharacterized protein n=1 Tax=hydrocarbon metagenome TaxID=938273 RepID=A0A0W8EKT4_9ZZZZ
MPGSWLRARGDEKWTGPDHRTLAPGQKNVPFSSSRSVHDPFGERDS